ncbi:MAG: PD-(D/E)XK nuclease domain-containing protein, partial [Bacteroidales bacterium]|nr:PD-(D/E)XK nuclease domain-containing protein [Bacteroidales bacterium]
LTEKENSRGRADIIIETNDYVYIFEFKLDGTAAEALKQIEDKGYAEPYAADKRKLFRIGVSFSSENRNIVEWKAV